MGAVKAGVPQPAEVQHEETEGDAAGSLPQEERAETECAEW